MNSPKKLIIFRKKTIRVSKEPAITQIGGIQVLNLADLARRMHAVENGEDETPVEYETKKILEYVAMVDTPSEVAKIVRASPLEQYILFEGDMHEIKVPMQVLIDGRAADTLEAEWRTGDNDIEISDEIRNLQINEGDADMEIPPHV
jgi:hypothetical protein